MIENEFDWIDLPEIEMTPLENEMGKIILESTIGRSGYKSYYNFDGKLYFMYSEWSGMLDVSYKFVDKFLPQDSELNYRDQTHKTFDEIEGILRKTFVKITGKEVNRTRLFIS